MCVIPCLNLSKQTIIIQYNNSIFFKDVFNKYDNAAHNIGFLHLVDWECKGSLILHIAYYWNAFIFGVPLKFLR